LLKKDCHWSPPGADEHPIARLTSFGDYRGATFSNKIAEVTWRTAAKNG
jgi:hypothetical protein